MVMSLIIITGWGGLKCWALGSQSLLGAIDLSMLATQCVFGQSQFASSCARIYATSLSDSVSSLFLLSGSFWCKISLTDQGGEIRLYLLTEGLLVSQQMGCSLETHI